MRWLPAGAMMLGLVTPAAAQLRPATSISMMRVGSGWQQALFVCDSTDRDRVLVMSAPDARRRATLTSLAKPGLAARTMPVRIGEGEAGMSQVHYPLLDGAGAVSGNVHTVSPAVVEPGATTPTVTSITIGRESSGCRFAPQTRILGVTARRSIQIVATPRNGYRYRSYNYDTNLPELSQPWGGRDTRASLSIDNGRLVEQRDGRRAFEFRNAGYLYRVFASVDTSGGGGGVQVWMGDRLVLAEPFHAYTAALKP